MVATVISGCWVNRNSERIPRRMSKIPVCRGCEESSIVLSSRENFQWLVFLDETLNPFLQMVIGLYNADIRI